MKYSKMTCIEVNCRLKVLKLVVSVHILVSTADSRTELLHVRYRCWYYESEGIMGPHTTLTPKNFKLDVHLGAMQVPLSTNSPIKL